MYKVACELIKYLHWVMNSFKLKGVSYVRCIYKFVYFLKPDFITFLLLSAVTISLVFYSLLQVATASASSWTGHTTMIGIFRNMFGSQSCPHIVKYNDFSNFMNYFIQKVCFNTELSCSTGIVSVWVHFD